MQDLPLCGGISHHPVNEMNEMAI